MKEEQITDPVEYWEHLLTHFSKRSSSSSSSSSQSHSLVLLGDENTGKKSLLANYLTTSPPSAQLLPSSSLLSYDYLLLSDDQNSSSNSNSNGSSSTSTAASLEFSSKVNVWSLNERNFHQFHGIIFDSVKKNQAKILLSITINLSSEDSLYSLQYWLQIVKSLQNSYPNLSFPTLVIGCKSDLLNVNDGEHLLKARTLQGRIRLQCLKANAALVYCSIGNSGAAPTPSVNLDIIRNLWTEMLTLDSTPHPSSQSSEVKEGMTDLIVPTGADSEALITAATGLLSSSNALEETKEWKEWLQQREVMSLKESSGATADPKDPSRTPLLRMVREAEEEEDQWLQTLRDALGTSTDGDANTESTSSSSSASASGSASSTSGTPSILDTLAAAPSHKPVSRRASSHVSESTATSTSSSQLGSKPIGTASSLQKKRSSVMSHSASSSSLAQPQDGKSSTGNGKEVKSFFENFLTPGAAAGSGASGSSATQKK